MGDSSLESQVELTDFLLQKDKKNKEFETKMSSDYNTQVFVTPSAIATIVDAHERRGGSGDNQKKYVIGTCIGNIEGNNTYIDQVFIVNYEMRASTGNQQLVFQLDKQHQAEMLNLTQAASPDQSVVGWFSTSHDVDFQELDKPMFDYYSTEAQKPQGSSFYTAHKKVHYNKPLFLRVNVQVVKEQKSTSELPIKAYLPETFNVITDDDGGMQYDLMCNELSVTIAAGAAERTALQMINGCTETDENKRPQLTLDAVGSNLDPLNNLTADMLHKISEGKSYIDDNLESGEDLDSTTGRMLSEIFNGVPGLDAEQLDKMLNAELTDLLMVTYLSQLANVQLTLNDKLKNAFAQTPGSAERKIAGKNKPRATLN